jgi:hypothetical protein
MALLTVAAVRERNLLVGRMVYVLRKIPEERFFCTQLTLLPRSHILKRNVNWQWKGLTPASIRVWHPMPGARTSGAHPSTPGTQVRKSTASCHAERSEGSLTTLGQILHCVQNDRPGAYSCALVLGPPDGMGILADGFPCHPCSQDEHRLHRFIAAALKMDLVALDELGFIPFTATGAQALFTFCSELYERLSFILTTNLKFADWVQVFGDERLTAALLDRLTHHAHIIELVGESYRFRQRMQKEVKEE